MWPSESFVCDRIRLQTRLNHDFCVVECWQEHPSGGHRKPARLFAERRGHADQTAPTAPSAE